MSSYTPASSGVAVEKGPHISIGTQVCQVGDGSYHYYLSIVDPEYCTSLKVSILSVVNLGHVCFYPIL